VTNATTVRFTDEVFARLDQASARTGMPVNSIVVAACLEWMQRHTPDPLVAAQAGFAVPMRAAPRWATLRRAVERAAQRRTGSGVYPFERFTATAQKLLTSAQAEASNAGLSYIGTEHMLLAAVADSASLAGQALGSLGITEIAVREKMAAKPAGRKRPGKRNLVPTSDVRAVIELAFQLCIETGDSRVNTAHILLALAEGREGVAARVLADAGVDRAAIAAAVEALTEPES
jgi:hypothetical protein